MNGDWYRRCGLRPLPSTLRMRVLDSRLRKELGGLGDVCAPIEELARLQIAPSRAYLVENLQSALAFNDIAGAVIITGFGYAVERVEAIHWLHNLDLIYWGDIDTHGFAILSRVRGRFSKLRSVLMDEATLLAHRYLWVEEMNQHGADELPCLTGDEQALYRTLKQQRWGMNIRLEQERIPWPHAWQVVRDT